MQASDFITTLQKSQSLKDKQVLRQNLINIIRAIQIQHILFRADELKEIFSIFQKWILEILRGGDILDSSFVYLAFIAPKDYEDNEEFEPFVRLADTMLTQNPSQEEWAMLVELGAIARILKSPKSQSVSIYERIAQDSNSTIQTPSNSMQYSYNDGLYFFLVHSMLGNISSYSMQKTIQFITEAMSVFEVDFGFIESAIIEAFHKADSNVLRRNIFNWQLHVLWNIPSLFNNKKWLGLYGLWKELLYNALDSSDANKIDEALYIQFFIYHICGNSFISQEQWKNFNKEISQKTTKAYKEFAQRFALDSAYVLPPNSESNTLDSKPKSSKIVIGFLRDRMVENSPFKVEYSLIANLMNNKEFTQKYEIKLYIMSLLEKSDNDPAIVAKFQNLGLDIIDIGMYFNQAGYYNSHLQKALALQNQIQKDNVSILISPNNGYGISDYLLATRSTKVQVFYSHGNFVYDIEGIDYRMTHICDNQRIIVHENFEFLGIPVKMADTFYTPYIPSELIQAERAKYPKDKKIIGVIGRLTKIDSLEYLRCICALLESHNDWIFLACGIGNEVAIKQKVSQINPAIMERFYLAGYVNGSIYGHIIDFWADSFPMEQGESRIEYVAKARGLALKLSKQNLEDYEQTLRTNLAHTKQTIIELEEQIQMRYEEFERLSFSFRETLAFGIEEYIQKAQYIMDLDSTQLQKLIDKQTKIFEVGALLKARLGEQYFLDFCEQCIGV